LNLSIRYNQLRAGGAETSGTAISGCPPLRYERQGRKLANLQNFREAFSH